ncbi:MAG: threonylcarbamoyl-AMP synthase [Spirochaetaceae bacterium]|jgi:L-threonylcarbamoyladenylate synthase|nr:threonylcarbamoyl-AMP synthase [Spirochaetaceae bacterium]
MVLATEENIQKAADVLRRGGVAAFPTETVYGLGASAFNRAAVARVFELKKRPSFDPLIVHIGSLSMLESAANLEALKNENRKLLEKLIQNLWPGPLTIVLPKKNEIPDVVTSGLDSVAVRFPKNEIAQKLILLTGDPLAAPSANPFGRLSPTRAAHVSAYFPAGVDIILDGGKTDVGLESTVLDLSSGAPRVLREGGVPQEEIERFTGKMTSRALNSPMEAEGGAFKTPGALKIHYAPKTVFKLHEAGAMLKEPFSPSKAYLFYSFENLRLYAKKNGLKINENELPAHERLWALCGGAGEPSCREAAAALFDVLHMMDALDALEIHAEKAPPDGLGPAINDRLFKAAGSVLEA